MKALLAILLLLLPSCLLAQITHDITGIWTGTLSTTERKLPYEVVITDSSGILSGYSHITFNVKGKEIIAVKKITVTNEDGIITLEDEDLIDNNFQEVQAKRVKQIATLSLMVEDSIMRLAGPFKVKRVLNERPISGNIVLQKREPSDTSKLMDKLKAMDLANSLSFLQLKKETGKVASEPIAVAKPTEDNSLANKRALPVAPPVIPKPVVEPPKDTVAIVAVVPKPKPKDTVVVAVAPVKVTKAPAIVAKDSPVVAIKQPPVVKPPVVVVAPPKPKVVTTVVAPPVKKPVKEPTAVVAAPKPKPVVVAKPVAPKPVTVVTPPPAAKPVVVAPPVHVMQNKAENVSGAAADIAHRQIETIETLTIESDSIVVTLYDNGYVDGDTVSILLNNQVIMGKVGLSTHPVTKTIYVTPDLGDSLQFVMYAENLGSIPPNTGLMILQDGRKRYEIFFSGDLEKNAAITLRKKRPDLN